MVERTAFHISAMHIKQVIIAIVVHTISGRQAPIHPIHLHPLVLFIVRVEVARLRGDETVPVGGHLQEKIMLYIPDM